jgi:hypothetical protein
VAPKQASAASSSGGGGDGGGGGGSGPGGMMGELMARQAARRTNVRDDDHANTDLSFVFCFCSSPMQMPRFPCLM